MAITQAMCTSFKQALLDGEMDFSSDTAQTFKIALYTSSASLDAGYNCVCYYPMKYRVQGTAQGVTHLLSRLTQQRWIRNYSVSKFL